MRVDPEEVTLGEHIAVRIAVEHDAREVYALPVFDPAPLAVRRARRNRGRAARSSGAARRAPCSS